MDEKTLTALHGSIAKLPPEAGERTNTLQPGRAA